MRANEGIVIEDQPQPAAPEDQAVDPAGVPEELDDESAELDQVIASEQPIAWQASEYVHHHKGASWYGILAAIVFVLLAVAVIFHLWLSVGVFLAMGAAIVVYAQKPPRILGYELDGESVTIDGKSYPYHNFRSYAVLSDIEWHAIDLEPTQRFMPRLTVLFGDDDFDLIVDHLSLHLPRVDRQPDVIERLSRYLRF